MLTKVTAILHALLMKNYSTYEGTSGRSDGLIIVRSTPDRAIRVQALAGDIVSCSWARHFTLTVHLSAQVYKWVLANLLLGVMQLSLAIPWGGPRARGHRAIHVKKLNSPSQTGIMLNSIEPQ